MEGIPVALDPNLPQAEEARKDRRLLSTAAKLRVELHVDEGVRVLSRRACLQDLRDPGCRQRDLVHPIVADLELDGQQRLRSTRHHTEVAAVDLRGEE